MKYLRITFLIISVAYIFNAFALEREITVSTPGSLSGIISDTERDEITSLKIAGCVNGSDMALIRYMAGAKEFNEMTPGKLESLDMSEARIVAEDIPYLILGDDSYNSEDDVLGPYMLYGCASLKKLSLPSTLKKIGDVSLGWCTQLEALEIPHSVEYIGIGAFTFCESIKFLRVPDSVTKVGASCFEYMSSLQELYIGNGLRALPRNALSCDDSLVTYI